MVPKKAFQYESSGQSSSSKIVESAEEMHNQEETNESQAMEFTILGYLIESDKILVTWSLFIKSN